MQFFSDYVDPMGCTHPVPKGETCSTCPKPEQVNRLKQFSRPASPSLTLPAVLAELDAVARDFGYPVDWACPIIEARLRWRFEDDAADDNILAFHLARENDAEQEVNNVL